MSVEKVEVNIVINDNFLEIIPEDGIKDNSIYEVIVKNLKPNNIEMKPTYYISEEMESITNVVPDVKIKFVTAMVPMYCSIAAVESLLDIVDVPDEMILYNIREASKYAEYIFETISKRNEIKSTIPPQIDKDNVPFAINQFTRYKAAKDCLLKIYVSLATDRMLEGVLGEVKFKIRDKVPDLKNILTMLDVEIQKWLDAIRGTDLEGRAKMSTAVKGYKCLEATPKRTPLGLGRGVYRDDFY